MEHRPNVGNFSELLTGVEPQLLKPSDIPAAIAKFPTS